MSPESLIKITLIVLRAENKGLNLQQLLELSRALKFEYYYSLPFQQISLKFCLQWASLSWLFFLIYM